jgi:hypothetical protein
MPPLPIFGLWSHQGEELGNSPESRSAYYTWL